MRVDFSAAAGGLWDLAVIGAGPAGALLAYLCSRGGMRTLLIEKDRFPRAKVCGCCLNEESLATLERCGLSPLAEKARRQGLQKLQLISCRGRKINRATLPLSGGGVLSRSLLDSALVDAARGQGAVFLSPCEARVLPAAECGGRLPPFRRLKVGRDTAAEVVSARLVACATGLRYSPFAVSKSPASFIGAGAGAAGARVEPGEVKMICAEGGYLGAVCLEDGSSNFAAALSTRLIRRGGGLKAAADLLLAQGGLADGPAAAAAADENRLALSWRGTPPLSVQATTLARQRVFLLGDCAGFVEPFTGEGISWALGSAEALAAILLLSCEPYREQVCDSWTAEHRRLLRRRQSVCRGVTAMLRVPFAARVVVGMLAADIIPKEIVSRTIFPGRRRLDAV